jgi:hypothetical protein
MHTFTIYRKKGKCFECEFDQFKLDEKGERFDLRGSNNTEGFLLAEQIAAIVPKDVDYYKGVFAGRTLLWRKFTIYLKNRLDKPVEITATAFDPTTYEFEIENNPISLIYVCPDRLSAYSAAT